MIKTQLRVYYGPTETSSEKPSHEDRAKETVTLPLSEIAPLLADAVRDERTWLCDFKDDELVISSDLYEVLLAYQHFCRPSA